jgi:hypothetical protein
MSIIWKKLPSVNSGMYYQTLFDYVQTHGLYGIQNTPSEISRWKNYLKEHGATKFRVVKNDYGKAIICFCWVRDEVAECKKYSEKILAEEKHRIAEIVVKNSGYGKFYEQYSNAYLSPAIADIRDRLISSKILEVKNLEDLMSESDFKDKDMFRIYGIIEKSLKRQEAYLYADIDWDKARKQAYKMADAITSAEKMIARKIAAEKLGFFKIAKYFEKE